MKSKTKVIKGARYGAWTIIKEVEPRVYSNRAKRMVLCECDCGERREMYLGGVIYSQTQHCRKCHDKEVKSRRNYIIVKNGQNLKRCQKCKIMKPVNEFYKNKSAYDELGVACKDCCRAVRPRRKVNKHVYILTHPLFDGWVKIGITSYLTKRLKNYQINDPMRSYEIYFSKWFEDAFRVEKYFKNNVPSNGYEWFEISKEKAKIIIIKLSKNDF